MDNLTHTLSGLVAARLMPARELPMRTRYIAGALAANFPDLDIVLAPISSELYLMHHRGETHSLLMLPLLALLLSWLFSKMFRSPGGWRDFYALSAVMLLVHIFGDWITGYGTQLFAPLTRETFSLGTTFIIDPLMTLILLGGFLGSLLWKASPRAAQISAVLVMAWIGTQLYWKQQALDAGKAYAFAQGLGNVEVSAEPRPLSPFNWTVIVREPEHYHYAHLKLNAVASQSAPADAAWLVRALAEFQPPALASWHTVAKFGHGHDNALARDIWARPELAFFRWFADAPALYRIDRHPQGSCVWFEDLRFAMPGRESPFLFGLCGPDWQSYRLGRDGHVRPFR
ncbi:MAG: metal-dependent hydrolase [Pseudomonadota bacterium]